VNWFKEYKQKMPDAPNPLYTAATKTYINDLMIVRVPLLTGEGEMFFAKKLNGTELQVVFFRRVGSYDNLSKNFTGYYESINMRNFVYCKIDYKSGNKVHEFKSKPLFSKNETELTKNLSTGVNSCCSAFPEYSGSWIGALIWCLSKHLSVPFKNSLYGGWNCTSPEATNNELQPGDSGGGGIDMDKYFPIVFPPNPFQPGGHQASPPSVWDLFNFTPPVGGLQPGTGGASLKTIKEQTDYLVNVLELDLQHSFFLENNPNVVELLFDYMYNDNSIETNKIASWAMQYLIQNPFCDLGEFKNKFLGKSDGYDADFDEVYWSNSNNYFPPQSLPTWDAFNLAYPKTDKGENMPAAEVFTKIGGDVKDGRDRSLVDPNQTPWNNACALRLSWALNKCNIKIPYIKGQTLKGGDGNFYFLGARNMNMWMRKIFGCSNPNRSLGEFYNPQAHHYDQSKVGKFGVDLEKELKDGKFHGIYTIVTKSKWASGHCDLLQSNATCLLNCHFADAAEYIEYCDVWNLK
jgi:hypothetical protein